MKDKHLKLASSSWDHREIEALYRVIESGSFSMASQVSDFEKRFAEFFGVKHAVMVNSGSSANLLMVAALFFRKENPLRPGDEVIVPAISWSTTYFPLHQYGLKLVFVDIDQDTLNYDLVELEKSICDNTRLIMVVNLLGNPNEFKTINRIANGRSIELIEDNCESMGGAYDGSYTGTFGVMGSFSTYFSHHISTMEGGVIVTNDEELFHILLCLRSHGWTRHLPNKNRITGIKSSDSFEESFNFVLPGYNVRPIEMMGAVGLVQLEKLEKILALRRSNAEVIREILDNHQDLMLQSEIGKSSWFGFSLTVRPESDWSRPILRAKLDALSVEYRPIVAGNFIKNPVCRFLNHRIQGTLVNASYIDQQGLFIGNNGQDMRTEFSRLKSL